MQLAAPRPLIERLNIFQAMIEAVTAEIDFVLRHRIEHERVIRVGGMTKGKDFSALHFHLFRCLLIIRPPRRLLAKTFGVAWTKGRMIRLDSSIICLSGPVNKRLSAMKAMRRSIALPKRLRREMFIGSEVFRRKPRRARGERALRRDRGAAYARDPP